MANQSEKSNIALFVDVENLVRSAMEIALPVDLGPIINKLLEYGRVSVRRGFGDLDGACKGDWQLRMSMRRMIHENLVQFEDIPYITRFKNTADMRLAVEALSVAYANPEIEYFAIVAADRDYVPLIAKLREMGRYIIGVGTSPDTVHEIYVKSCDIFLYYTSLFQTTVVAGHPMQEEPDESLLDSYLQLLVQATSALARKGVKPVGGQLVPLMRQLRPDFDLKLVRINSFRDLVDLAESRKLVRVGSSGADILVSPADGSETLAEAPRSAQRIDTSDTAGAKMLYMNFLEEKMKCPLPSLAVRRKIYDEASRTVEKEKILGKQLNLVEIATEVGKKLGEAKSGLTQPMVFKVLYSIYRAQAFEAELTEEAYNPKIKGTRTSPEDWDQLFIKNSLTVIVRERRTWPLIEGPLAELFETTPERIRSVIEQVEY
jgi:uncharacterized protein (TIGR00288 family)